VSQWGEKRTFNDEKAMIEVLPGVDTRRAFDPINLESTIRRICVLNSVGSPEAVQRLTKDVQKKYVGRPYAEWRRPEPPHPLDNQAHAAIRSMRDMTTGPGFLEEIPCKIRQWGDETGCITPGCGLRWDTNDLNPPRCPRYAVAVQRRKLREVSQAQRRLSALYSEPGERRRRLLDIGERIALCLSLFVGFYVLFGRWLGAWPF
jgi:hypothetical protein